MPNVYVILGVLGALLGTIFNYPLIHALIVQWEFRKKGRETAEALPGFNRSFIYVVLVIVVKLFAGWVLIRNFSTHILEINTSLAVVLLVMNAFYLITDAAILWIQNERFGTSGISWVTYRYVNMLRDWWRSLPTAVANMAMLALMIFDGAILFTWGIV